MMKNYYLCLFVLMAVIEVTSYRLPSKHRFLEDQNVQRQAFDGCEISLPTYKGLGETCQIPNREVTPYCQENLFCSQNTGTCLSIASPPSTCANDLDCYGDCIDNKCQVDYRLPGESCDFNEQCESKQCTSGKCITKALGETCESFQCANGLFCNNGVCASKLPANADCSAVVSPNTVFRNLDRPIICQPGYYCSTIRNVSTYDVISATCRGVGSVAAGSTTGDYASYVCAEGTYAVYNQDTGVYTCVSQAPACQYGCTSYSESSCICTSSNTNGNGTCSATPCAASDFSVLSCLSKLDFGVSEYYRAAFVPSTSAYSSCHSAIVDSQCCNAKARDGTVYIPSGFCNSSDASILLPFVAIIALLSLFV